MRYPKAQSILCILTLSLATACAATTDEDSESGAAAVTPEQKAHELSGNPELLIETSAAMSAEGRGLGIASWSLYAVPKMNGMNGDAVVALAADADRDVSYGVVIEGETSKVDFIAFAKDGSALPITRDVVAKLARELSGMQRYTATACGVGVGKTALAGLGAGMLAYVGTSLLSAGLFAIEFVGWGIPWLGEIALFHAATGASMWAGAVSLGAKGLRGLGEVYDECRAGKAVVFANE